MAKKFNGELLHFGSARFRVTGSGILDLTLKALQNTTRYEMPSYNMNDITDLENVKLANFIKQRAQLEFRTLDINEWFRVSRIVIFVRPIGTGYPQ